MHSPIELSNDKHIRTSRSIYITVTNISNHFETVKKLLYSCINIIAVHGLNKFIRVIGQHFYAGFKYMYMHAIVTANIVSPHA